MGKNRGKATRIAHRIAAAKPKAKALIKELAKEFENWPQEVRKKKLSTLLAIDGISVRGLAEEAGIADSTLRHYVDPTPPVKKVDVPRKRAPRAKLPVRVTAASHPPVAQPKPPSKVRQQVRVCLPPRPDFSAQLREREAESRAREAESRERSQLLFDYLQLRAVRLDDMGFVLTEVSRQERQAPSPFNQALRAMPTGQQRIDLFNRVSTGAHDCERFYQLAVGMRNIMRELGGEASTWRTALDDVLRMSKGLAPEAISEQPTFRPAVEYEENPEELHIQEPSWRRGW